MKIFVRVAVGLRLGAALCPAHQCPCGALVEVNGLRGLSCKLGPGKHSRQAAIHDIIYRVCCRVDISAVKEPTELARNDGKCPSVCCRADRADRVGKKRW